MMVAGSRLCSRGCPWLADNASTPYAVWRKDGIGFAGIGWVAET